LTGPRRENGWHCSILYVLVLCDNGLPFKELPLTIHRPSFLDGKRLPVSCKIQAALVSTWANATREFSESTAALMGDRIGKMPRAEYGQGGRIEDRGGQRWSCPTTPSQRTRLLIFPRSLPDILVAIHLCSSGQNVSEGGISTPHLRNSRARASRLSSGCDAVAQLGRSPGRCHTPTRRDRS
jgi:hypothetical protein